MESERNSMTTTEVARYLGLKPSYLYKVMIRRAIPYYEPGGKLRFFAKGDLDAWLKRVRVKSQAETGSKAPHYLVTHEKDKWFINLSWNNAVMGNSRNMEPGIRNATAQESPDKEQRKKESKPVISTEAQIILDFLRGCSPYETDSIRVMIGYGTGNGDTATIEAMDMLAVNRFLNHGFAKENGASNETVMKHRQERVQRLLEAIKDFVDIGQLCRVSIVLMKISSDFKAVEDAWGYLQSQPATNVNRN